MEIKVIKLLAASDAVRCDCEHDGCHAGDCYAVASYRIEVFGMKQNLCANCLKLARPAPAASGQREMVARLTDSRPARIPREGQAQHD